MNNKDFKGKADKLDFWISMIANLITIGTPITTYFIANNVFLYVAVVFLLITIVRNILKEHKIEQYKNEIILLKNSIEVLNQENTGYENRLNRVQKDLLSGKVSSDILINNFIDEVDNQYITYISMNIDAHIIYQEKAKLYDVRYLWSVNGHNPSKEDVLSELCFIISGDSIIKNNNELEAIAEIKRSNEKWEKVNSYINGADKIKYLHIDLGNNAILPNHHFNIRFSYVWPKTFNAEGGDVFSFGNNTFSSTDPYDLFITVHGNKKCFSSATQQIRDMIDKNDIKQQYAELRIFEKDEENYISTSLHKSENNRAIYINIIQ